MPEVALRAALVASRGIDAQAGWRDR